MQVLQVDMNVGKLIAQGRQAKEMSQKDLATKICEKPQVAAISDFSMISVCSIILLKQSFNKM